MSRVTNFIFKDRSSRFLLLTNQEYENYLFLCAFLGNDKVERRAHSLTCYSSVQHQSPWQLSMGILFIKKMWLEKLFFILLWIIFFIFIWLFSGSYECCCYQSYYKEKLGKISKSPRQRNKDIKRADGVTSWQFGGLTRLQGKQS